MDPGSTPGASTMASPTSRADTVADRVAGWGVSPSALRPAPLIVT